LLIGPLLVAHPRLVTEMVSWSRHRNMWVRRAAAVSLIASVRRGVALDTAYEIARRLHRDREDLLQKAVGWMLREAGKADAGRLERYLRANGPSIPRTTVRYAIERCSPAKRRELLAVTRTTIGMVMGAETTCTVTVKGKSSTAKVRLETNVLQIRGTDLKLDVPFSAMKKVTARDGALYIAHAAAPLTLALGKKADRWVEKILHPPSRLAKLGVRPGWRAAIVGDLDREFADELRDAVATFSVGRMLKQADAVFVAISSRSDFDRVATAKSSIKSDGAVWLIRPKGNAEVTEGSVMAAGKAAGLVDVKVVAFSATHSAMKFVIPVKDRSRS
jgi:DNA alkylation repair enzyme